MRNLTIKAPLILKNIGFSTITNMFDRLGTALVLFLISKELGKVATGSYELGVTYYSLGIIFAAWGLGSLLVREVASERQAFAKYFSNYLVIRLIVGALTGLFVILLGSNLVNYEPITRRVIVILALCIPLTALSSLIQSAFIAFEKLKVPSVISIATTVIRVAGTFLLIRFGSDPLLKVAWFQLVVFSLILIIYFITMLRLLPDWKSPVDWAFISQQLTIAIPFFLFAAIMTLDNRIDVILISFFLKEDSVGIYGVMTMLLGIVYLAPEGIRNAILPALARYRKISQEMLREKFRLMIKYSLLVTIPMASAGFFLSRHLVNFLYKGQYTLVIRLLQIAIWSVVSYTLIILFSHLLIIQKREKTVVMLALISAIITIGLNLLTIRPFRLEGPASVKLITSVLLLFGLIAVVWRDGFRFSIGKEVVFILLAGLLMTLAIYLTSSLWIGIRIGLGLVVYLLVLTMTKTFSFREGMETLGLQTGKA